MLKELSGYNDMEEGEAVHSSSTCVHTCLYVYVACSMFNVHV